METKTIHELRALARELGLKGYSKLRKKELVELIIKTQKRISDKLRSIIPSAAEPQEIEPGETRARPGEPEIPPPMEMPTPPAGAGRAPAEGEGPVEFPRIATEEERVENAKYSVAPPGVRWATHVLPPDLGEDIERLPAHGEPTVYLLPQKPGILHTYWRLEPGSLARQPNLKFRLCTLRDGALQVVQEMALPGDEGHWYLHVPETLSDTEVYLQVGYERDGGFISAIRRGIARIASLYASERTDRSWWISEEQFREMYVRAGGFAAGPKLGWAASAPSSPGPEAPAPRERRRLAWPGFISSR